MKLPRVIGIAKAAAARRARLHPPTRVTLRCLVRDAAARVPKYKPKYCILCNAEFTPTSGKQLGRVLVKPIAKCRLGCAAQLPFLGVKRTWRELVSMTANDPKRTCSGSLWVGRRLPACNDLL